MLPGFNKIKAEANKVRDAANLKQICEAWQFFADQCIDPKANNQNGCNRVCDLVTFYAGRTWPKDFCRINDASVYISSGDKYASKVGTGIICTIDNSQKLKFSDDFWKQNVSELHKSGTSNSSEKWIRCVISYCIINKLPIESPRSTTPVAFTRGLCSDGTWHEKYGLYGNSGGYVIFGDGHIRWFDGKRPARFLKWDQSGYTSDIRETLPNSSWIMCGCDAIRTDITNKNGAIMITYHQCTGGEG